MEHQLYIHNSLTRKKELFQPINPPFVGIYVCGPTVYSDVHLGNCRTMISFDVMYRYLLFLGYKVRYVRNITDVGHLLDDGEDRILKATRLEQLEPMEVVQKYTNGFHNIMREFNTLPPSIEPRATQHILEQIEMVETIIKNGYGYEVNGSVYFDTVKFANEKNVYGQLSGRVIEKLHTETRDLKNQSEKKHPSDFAIWMKASPEHIMRWKSPWSEGFPGWHLECSVMSTKYLGTHFDIHGGGTDLKFPHHENEIAQNYGACNCAPSRYWIHTNMLELEGKKMSKSDGNTISPAELFSGNSPFINKGFSPIVVRFFMLQTHYRSTNDISNDALLAAEKGYRRLMEANRVLQHLSHDGTLAITDEEEQVKRLMDHVLEDMNDDFNTPKAISRLFVLSNKINSFQSGQIALNSIAPETLETLKKFFHSFIFDVLGLKEDTVGPTGTDTKVLDGLMELVLGMRQKVRTDKDWATSDKIRDSLAALNIVVKDDKEGSTWSVKN